MLQQDNLDLGEPFNPEELFNSDEIIFNSTLALDFGEGFSFAEFSDDMPDLTKASQDIVTTPFDASVTGLTVCHAEAEQQIGTAITLPQLVSVGGTNRLDDNYVSEIQGESHSNEQVVIEEIPVFSQELGTVLPNSYLMECGVNDITSSSSSEESSLVPESEQGSSGSSEEASQPEHEPPEETRRTRATRSQKRLISESSSCSSHAPRSQDRRNGKKKQKMYEGDPSDEKVKRASYAKGYRERQKQEKDKLQLQLDHAEAERDTYQKRVEELEEVTTSQLAEMTEMKNELDKARAEVTRMKRECEEVKARSACTPSKQRKMLSSISAVVQAASHNCSSVALLVPEKLANKPCAELTKKEIDEICSAGDLSKSKFTLVLSMSVADDEQMTITNISADN